MVRTMTSTGGSPLPWGRMLTTEGRAAAPFGVRVGAAFGTVAFLHLLGGMLLAGGLLDAVDRAVVASLAFFGYARGLAHSFDFDHLSMIDNSTRKFVTEGRRPASVGLAFSAGHSTVVLCTGILVITGAQSVRGALDPTSPAAHVLGMIGLSVSGLYLLLVGMANVAGFHTAWALRRLVRENPGCRVPLDALTPRGPAARVLTAPLRRVRHPRHVYLIGMLFSLGFDTSSQIGLLMLTGGAALSGVAPLSLLAVPVLFAAAMTLGDTCNGLVMLKLHVEAHANPLRRIGFNLVVSAVSICSAIVVVVAAGSTLLSQSGLGRGVPALDPGHAGYVLAGCCAGLLTIGTVSRARLRTWSARAACWPAPRRFRQPPPT